MKNPDEDYAYGVRRQAEIDANNTATTPQWQCKIGTVVPFSRTVDRDQFPRIPLSVPEDVPSGNWVWVYIVLAVCLFVAVQWWQGVW